MKVTIVGIVIALLGVVVLALAPSVRRSLVRRQNPQATYLYTSNVVTGLAVVVFGILIAAHVFGHN